MAGASFERQETGFVNAINDYYTSRDNRPFNLTAGSVTLRGVISARKVEGRLPNGNEPYPDVEITTSQGMYKVSMKGPTAPSIAGGGLAGLERTVPGFSGRFLEAALSEYLKRGYQAGDQIPDIYGEVGEELKQTIVLGTPAIGGPITHMYIGPMDVSSNGTGLSMRVNGRLFDASRYAADHDLYLRLRKRRADQPFDPSGRDRDGLPKILGRSPTAGDSSRRIVIVNRPPSNAILVTF